MAEEVPALLGTEELTDVADRAAWRYLSMSVSSATDVLPETLGAQQRLGRSMRAVAQLSRPGSLTPFRKLPCDELAVVVQSKGIDAGPAKQVPRCVTSTSLAGLQPGGGGGRCRWWAPAAARRSRRGSRTGTSRPSWRPRRPAARAGRVWQIAGDGQGGLRRSFHSPKTRTTLSVSFKDRMLD